METEKEINGDIPPDLILFSGDWSEYENRLYEVFKSTICNSNLTFQSVTVSIKRQPDYKGKHFSFWHLISEGEKEEERIPDFRRCERLSWVNWIITNYDKNKLITYWENERRGQKHVVIWCEEHSYVVILAKRNGYYLLKTAYCVSDRRAKIFRRESSTFNKNNR